MDDSETKAFGKAIRLDLESRLSDDLERRRASYAFANAVNAAFCEEGERFEPTSARYACTTAVAEVDQAVAGDVYRIAKVITELTTTEFTVADLDGMLEVEHARHARGLLLGELADRMYSLLMHELLMSGQLETSSGEGVVRERTVVC